MGFNSAFKGLNMQQILTGKAY